jgi:hypothetical protein
LKEDIGTLLNRLDESEKENNDIKLNSESRLA